MIREIGSEFWNSNPQIGTKAYFLSGRTALEFIIRDILESRSFDSVLLPSYCCHTMIEPFVRHGIHIRFYDVYFDELEGLSIDLPKYKKNEIFFYMTYFGFNRLNGSQFKDLREKYDVIINDKTHSWLSGESLIEADYSFISFRKWNGFSGIAEAYKKGLPFCIASKNDINEEYVSMREKAAERKKLFIEKQIEDKSEFLKMFHDAEEFLENDYIGYRPSYKAVRELITCDWSAVKKRRRENAVFLMKELKGISGIQLLFENMNQEDIPLFVPIYVKDDRDILRKYLIENQVYCPVHWPLSNFHQKISTMATNLYNHELSIICDQRYEQNDMRKIVDLVRNYYG